MNTNKVVLGLIGGLAIGALAGVLFAPAKGSKTRKRIMKKGNDYTKDLKTKFEDMYNNVATKYDNVVEQAKALKVEVIVAVGHTDSVGTDAYNQKLSIRRAESVKKYLVSKGIEAKRIYVEGKGESQPVADNKTAEGRAKNRRVQIEAIGTRKN